jgi:hypothetical protein
MFRFFKTQDNRWYIDYPEFIESGGSIDDLEMVAGADELLNYASKGKSEVFVEIYTKKPTNFDYHLVYLEDYYGGANYMIRELGFEAWLCYVTEIIFGELPKNLYIRVVNNQNDVTNIQ